MKLTTLIFAASAFAFSSGVSAFSFNDAFFDEKGYLGTTEEKVEHLEEKLSVIETKLENVDASNQELQKKIHRLEEAVKNINQPQ